MLMRRMSIYGIFIIGAELQHFRIYYIISGMATIMAVLLQKIGREGMVV